MSGRGEPAGVVGAVICLPLVGLGVVLGWPIVAAVGGVGLAILLVIGAWHALRYWWRGTLVNIAAPIACLVAIGVFVVVSQKGPRGYWTWTLDAVQHHGSNAPDGGHGALARRLAGLLWWDVLIIATYLLAAVLVRTGTWHRTNRIEGIDPARFRPLAHRIRRGVAAGMAFVVATVVLDLAEDALTYGVLSGRLTNPSWSLIQAVSWTKLLTASFGLGLLALTAVTSTVRAHDLRAPRAKRGDLAREREGFRLASPRIGDEQAWHSGRAPAPDPSWAPCLGVDKVGVCLSGGGIRSASFSLGAMQAIEASDLAGILYVTSVSGGGYMAAAWASLMRPESEANIEAALEPSEQGVKPFKNRSPEERWVRHHTDYLIASFLRVIGVVLTLVLGLAFNLLLVFACIMVVGHPVGWAVRGAHPEMAARQPIYHVGTQPELAVVGAKAVPASVLAKEASCPSCVPTRIHGHGFLVTLGLVDETGRPTSTWSIGAAGTVDEHPSPRGVRLRLTPAIVAEGTEGLVVLRQPLLAVDGLEMCIAAAQAAQATPLKQERPPPVCPQRSSADEDLVRCPTGDDAGATGCLLDVQVQPTITALPLPEVSGSNAPKARLSSALVDRLVSVGEQPVVRQRTGTVGLPSPTYPPWMAMVMGLGALGLFLAWTTDALRARGNPDRHNASQAVMGLWVVAAMLLYVLPFLAHNLPLWVADLPGYRPEKVGWAALGAVLLALLPLARRAGGWLVKRFDALRGFRGRGYVIDAALGIFVYAIALGIFVSIVALAAANGPDGRLPGLVDQLMAGSTDLQRWAAVLAGLLLVFVLPVSSHAWSLYSAYRSALGSSYFLHAEREDRPDGTRGYRIARMDHEQSEAWRWGRNEQRIHGLSTEKEADEEWVVCTTANIRGAGEAAPGRASGSFTFSKSWVGGPEVGWMPTDEYLERLAPKRHRDVSVQSTVVISGAAFSPAMGKKSRTWQGRLFALANLRLGVWVPNPMIVARRPEGRIGRIRQPSAAWYLREVLGWFDRTAPYIYLTDGGHWENLGLVELLRRGCTDIWMISAAGDGADSFETTAQAFALAREEVGVEFGTIELEPLRPAARVDEDAPRRMVRHGTAQPTAPRGFIRGRFTYTLADGTQVPGTIHIIEATLLGDLPWDVHAYGEANNDFPDISTGYQMMDHRDFEAYRMLGHEQTSRALRARQEPIP